MPQKVDTGVILFFFRCPFLLEEEARENLEDQAADDDEGKNTCCFARTC